MDRPLIMCTSRRGGGGGGVLTNGSDWTEGKAFPGNSGALWRPSVILVHILSGDVKIPFL